MATTFHTVNFRNKTLNMLTGVNIPTPAALAFININNGTQPADPSVAVPGSSVYSSTGVAIPISGFMTASGGGISQINGNRSANASSTIGSLTWARIFDTSQVACIDATVGLASGGVIIDSLTSSVGSPLTVTQFSIKLPISFGTFVFSQSLVDRLVDMWTGNSATRPDLGTNAIIDLYTGSAPVTADLLATGTKVATFNGNATNWFNAAANGSITLASNPSALANGTGTAGYFRWYKTVGNILFTIQGSVGTTGTDLIFNTVALTSGVTLCTLVEATISL